MEDVAPDLIRLVTEEFRKSYASSGRIQQLLEKVKQKTATYAEAQEYAIEVSRLIGNAYEKHISSASLPDGRMYYNIASRLIPETLDENHKLVSQYAADVQAALNKNANIGLKVQTVEIDQDRVDGLVELAANAERYDDVSVNLISAFENFDLHIVDETIKKNAEFHYRSGLQPMIVRKAEPKCCKWCKALAGEYDYPDVPDDLYRRHERCRCVVEFDPGDGRRQNVHTKKWTAADNRDKIEQRKAFGLNTEKNRAARGMANGPRRGRLTNVSEAEQREIEKYANDLNIPRDILSFNTGPCTSFDDESGLIHIRGDIFPSAFAENPNSILSAKCALAHEYYGHYLHHSRFNAGDWRDEFQASYRAALDSPGLTQEERSMLMLDAFDRARNAGKSVQLNSVARRLLYGTE